MNSQEPLSDPLSLDELIEHVSQELRRMGLDALPDRRANLLPDVRMVRYYTTLGLLRPPRIVQRQAQYGPEHVEALLLVKLLQIQGLSLARIQQELLGLSIAQRQNWLHQLRQQERPVPLPQVIQWQEYLLEPGLRVQLRSDYACTNLEAVLHQVKTLLTQRLEQPLVKAGPPSPDPQASEELTDGSQYI